MPDPDGGKLALRLVNKLFSDLRLGNKLNKLFSDLWLVVLPALDGCAANLRAMMIFLVASLSFGAGSRDDDGKSLSTLSLSRFEKKGTASVRLRCKTNRARR